MAAGLTPRQFRVLADADPLVEMAEIKGRADGEYTAAKTMCEAARDGDSKAALEILKHQHGWVAKQQIDVNIDQQISITGALEKAQSRVIEGLYTELPRLRITHQMQAPIYSAQDEMELMARLWSPSLKDDPLAFVLYTFPWGSSAPLEHFPGPRKWQRQILSDLRDHIKQNNGKVDFDTARLACVRARYR